MEDYLKKILFLFGVLITLAVPSGLWAQQGGYFQANLVSNTAGFVAHRFDEAIKQIRKTIILEPFFGPAHYVLGQALVQKRNYNEAIAELQKAIELSPGSTAFTANLAYAYAVSGLRDEAAKKLDDMKNRSPQAFSNAPEIAMVYVGLDQKDQAMAWLEKGYAERFSPWVLMRPCFDP